jgi:hypothetical protein
MVKYIPELSFNCNEQSITKAGHLLFADAALEKIGMEVNYG